MAKLILTLDGVVLKEYALSKERTTIGRKAHNDIQIDNLAVSGEHAAIVTILNDSFLEDLGSTNGTLVNGQPIKKHFLQNTDTVEIGKYKLKYVNEQSGGTTQADFEKTMVLRPPSRPPGGAPGESLSGVPRQLTDTQINATQPPATPAAPTTPAAPRPMAPPPMTTDARRRAAGHHPDPVGPQRRQGTRARQGADHARQAWRPGRGDREAAAGLLHHPRRGRAVPGGQRPHARLAGVQARRS
jgi:hypothetical protein